MKQVYCKDCNKKIWYTSIRCKSCTLIKRNKSQSYRKYMSKKMKGRKITWDIFKGKKHTVETKLKISLANKGRTHSESHKRKISVTLKRKYKSGELKLKNQIQKHHIDMNHSNNKSSNIVILTSNEHRKLHAWGYNYLVDLGLEKQYVNWFMKKFKIKRRIK